MKKTAFIFSLLLAVLLSGCQSKPSDTDDVSDLVPTATPSVASEAASQEKIKIGSVKGTVSGLNLRKEASEDADILAVAEEGSYFYLADKEKTDGWYCIKYKDGIAYVSDKYFELKEVTASEAQSLLNKEEGGTPKEPKSSSEPLNKNEENNSSEKDSSSSKLPVINDGE